jgi:hypothetical protein
MQVSNFHFKGDVDGYTIEGDCECEYFTDEGEDIPRRKSMVFSDVQIVDNATGEPVYDGDDIPDEFINLVRDIADDEFIVA